MARKKAPPPLVDEVALVSIDDIEVDESENARRDLTNIDEFARGIEKHGLLTALTVTREPEGSKKPYRLRAGYRRMAALRLLKRDTPIPVTITSPVTPAIKNLIENIEREDLPAVDFAERLYELTQGKVPGEPAYHPRELGERLGMSRQNIINYVGCAKHLSDETKEVWRRLNPSVRDVIQWSRFTHNEQRVMVASWMRTQERMRELKKQKAEGTYKGRIRPKNGPEPLVNSRGFRMLDKFQQLLAWKLETGNTTEEERPYVEAQFETLKFVLGMSPAFPGVGKKDFQAYARFVEIENAAEEAAELEVAFHDNDDTDDED